ncbi:MAG: hypothetical protein M1480_18765 [Bacteroidetes bacterium]|nr:hypothetical protein [Bacteroidota bacterium]
MNYKKIKYLLLIIVSMLLLIPTAVNAKGDRKDKRGIAKTSVGEQITNTYFDINNVKALQTNNGWSDYNTNSNLEGTEYPKGSGKTAVFQSGFLWGGFIGSDPQVRVGGSAYRTGLQAGPILANGQAADASDPKYQIYRVRPDVYPGGPDIDLTLDAINESSTDASMVTDAATLRKNYESDWTNWPAAGTANDLGAPFKDVNNDGKYEPGIDVPGVPGADQTVYYVANDLDSSKTTYLYGTQPLGLELHATIWGYAQQGALGNMYFKKYSLINKGEQKNTIDSMFVSWWADIDLGDANDDLMGCDTTLSMAFAYNGKPVDAVYAPLPPPADGADFFQGPIVPGEPTDVAIFNGNYVPGKKNLPMTASYFFINQDPKVTDPPQGNPLGSTQFYRFFNGQYGNSGQPFIDPTTGNVTKFAFSGDPVAHTGWLDGNEFPPADRRYGMASGPFTMAPGDTQEIVVAEVFAGAMPGVDYLSAISLLKFYDRTAQSAYNLFFQLATPPAPPKVNVVQLSNKVMLDWGEDQNAINSTENNVVKGYTFEGYNVYQLPSKGATIDQAKRLATYDVVDNVLKITDDSFDPTSGEVVTKVSEFGTDSGIKRAFLVNTDAFNGNKPLVNGLQYYFAVTAYSYNATSVPHALENPIALLIATPQSPNPGVRYSHSAGDTIIASHASGKSEGQCFAIVIDPTRLTGDQYKVSFDTTGGSTTWTLTDVTKNKVVLSQQANQTGDDNYSIVDGMLVKVTGPAIPGVKDWDIPQGTRRFTWAGGADGFGFEGFNGAIGWAAPSTLFGDGLEPVPPSALSNTLLTLAQVTDTTSFNPTLPGATDVNMSYGYRYGRWFANPPAQPQFVPYIVNKSGGYSYQDFNLDVPLSAWNVEDPAHPARLVVGFLENNAVNGLVDGKYWPPDYSQYDNTASSGPREWLWIYQAPYSTTVDPNLAVECISNDLPIMWFCTIARRGPVKFSPDGTGKDQFIIYANHINTLVDQFTFTATAPSSSTALAKEDVNSINVFPNPYYGINTQETNKYAKFITFNHLPANATIRIFNLAGTMVRTINHSGNQFEFWDLTNASGLPVASGIYIAYIDMPDLGATKILKIAIVQEQQFLDRF